MVIDQCRTRDTARQYRESVRAFLRSGTDPVAWTRDSTVRPNTLRSRWFALAALHAWCGRFPEIAGTPPRAARPRVLQGPTLPALLAPYGADLLGLRGKLMVALAYQHDWKLARLRDATLDDLAELDDAPDWLRELLARYRDARRLAAPDAGRLFLNTRNAPMTRHSIAAVFERCGATTEQVRRMGRWARRRAATAPP